MFFYFLKVSKSKSESNRAFGQFFSINDHLRSWRNLPHDQQRHHWTLQVCQLYKNFKIFILSNLNGFAWLCLVSTPALETLWFYSFWFFQFSTTVYHFEFKNMISRKWARKSLKMTVFALENCIFEKFPVLEISFNSKSLLN